MSRPGLRRTQRARAGGWVARSDDQRLERTVGTTLGLRILFALLARALQARTDGLAATVACELHTTGGTARPWTLVFGTDGLRARPGRPDRAQLTVTLGVADLVRIAVGELDAGSALLTGRLDLAGDAALALRLTALLER